MFDLRVVFLVARPSESEILLFPTFSGYFPVEVVRTYKFPATLCATQTIDGLGGGGTGDVRPLPSGKSFNLPITGRFLGWETWLRNDQDFSHWF